MKSLYLMSAAASLLLAGCGSPDAANDDMAASKSADTTTMGTMPAEAGATQSAVAMLQTADGKPAGRATATAADGGVAVSLAVEGLPAGKHGAHVHTTGKCDAPKFETAGGHWNPTQAKHGLEDPAGQHAGDMPNLVVGEDGRGTLSYQLKGATFAGLLDGDGSAIVIHAGADDQKTDPSGDSGARIACGVFKAE